VKRESKNTYPTRWKDKEEDEYDMESDIRMQQVYDTLKEELKRLNNTKLWTSAKLYELYAFADITMEELSNQIGISKSTTFLHIKKIKKHLKNVIDNPFHKK
jgi:predicted DNA-binding protein YlxM (UPF0122 family)